jgi:hypothetical protein
MARADLPIHLFRSLVLWCPLLGDAIQPPFWFLDSGYGFCDRYHLIAQISGSAHARWGKVVHVVAFVKGIREIK